MGLMLRGFSESGMKQRVQLALIMLTQEAQREIYAGVGKLDALKHALSGC
jgi:hypothetical protein